MYVCMKKNSLDPIKTLVAPKPLAVLRILWSWCAAEFPSSVRASNKTHHQPIGSLIFKDHWTLNIPSELQLQKQLC